MRRSSIFSFDTLHGRLRLSGWILLFLVGLILAAEVVLRLPGVAGRLPEPELTLWHAPIIEAKIDYLRRFQADSGVDVLIIGNSTIQSGFDPVVFDASRARTAAGVPGAFNAALEGMPPAGMLPFLKIFLQLSQPEVIIYGLTAQDLNANSPWAQEVTDRVWHAPLVLAEAREGWRGRLIALGLRYSRLYRYRFVLHRLILGDAASLARPEVYFDGRGYLSLDRRLSDVPPEGRGRFVNNAGVLNYSVQGEQLEALNQLIAYVLERDITLILVNMPLADDYYANFDSLADYDRYLAALEATATRSGVTLIDFEAGPQADVFNDGLFADFNHLNQAGAETLSGILGHRFAELAAWPQP